MSQLALIFQTEPGRGTPQLKPMPGADVPWDDGELRKLEDDLTRQYPDLIRGKVGTVTFQSRPLRVTVQQDGRSRQPTVILTDESRPAIIALPPTGIPAWVEGLLAELDRVLTGGAAAGLSAFEQTVLAVVQKEMRSIAEAAGAEELARVLLAGHLTTAEHLCRPQDPERATMYGVALRGLDKLLTQVSAEEAGRPRGERGPGDGPAPRETFARRMLQLLGWPAPSH